ncbi:MAG: LapA family protein [bacterium]
MVKIINLVLLIIFIALVLIFTAENPELVSVKFLEFQSIKLPISVIVFSSVIIGIFIGLIYHFYIVYKLKKELKNDKEKL